MKAAMQKRPSQIILLKINSRIMRIGWNFPTQFMNAPQFVRLRIRVVQLENLHRFIRVAESKGIHPRPANHILAAGAVACKPVQGPLGKGNP